MRQRIGDKKELYLGMKLEAFYGLAKYKRELKNLEPRIEDLIGDLTQEVARLKDE